MSFNRIFALVFLVMFSFSLTASPIISDNPTFEFNVEYSQEGQIATLAWSFPNTNKVAYYICEKSKDGKNFSDFSKVVSNNDALLEIDEDIKSNKLYYRIKTVLKSGETITSDIQELVIKKQQVAINATFYPNPVIETANIKISNYFNQEVSITVYTDKGEEIQALVGQKGNDHKVDFSNFESGTYFIKAAIDDEVFVEKIDVIK